MRVRLGAARLTRTTCPILRSAQDDAWLVQIPLREVLVRVDAPVPQEGPVRAARLDLARIHGDREHLLAAAGFDQDPAAGIGDEAAAPELDAAVRVALVADAVDRANVHAVGDGMATLDRLPRGLLLV